jgi:hypothetical protein
MKAGMIAFLVMNTVAAELIDRIAVTIDKTVITESEIVRQIRITAFLNGDKPEINAETKRATADKLVDQALIRREIETNQYTLPARTESQRFLQFRTKFATESEYAAALAAYKLTDAEVRDAFAWQDTFLAFVGVRFSTGIQIPESELREYYKEKILPMASTHPEARISFEEARPQIESILMSQRVDNALDRWLGQARTLLRIRYRPEVFQ